MRVTDETNLSRVGVSWLSYIAPALAMPASISAKFVRSSPRLERMTLVLNALTIPSMRPSGATPFDLRFSLIVSLSLSKSIGVEYLATAVWMFVVTSGSN